jgi:hypothetical protein
MRQKSTPRGAMRRTWRKSTLRHHFKTEIDSEVYKATVSLRFQSLVLEKLSRWKCIASSESSSLWNFGMKFALGLLSRFWKI